jgi:hypothetical protein
MKRVFIPSHTGEGQRDFPGPGAVVMIDNGDGVMDLAVGSTRSNSPKGVVEAGTVSVFFGGSAYNGLPEKFEAVKDGQESALLYGSSDHEYVGEFLACGDLNNDGIDDLVVAAQRVLDTGMPVSAEAAKIYILYGGTGLSGNISLATQSDVVIQRTDSMHAETILVGDVNNDGIDDLVISDILTDSVKNPPVAPLTNGNKRNINGAVYIIHGGNLGAAVDPAVDSDAIIMRNSGADVFQVYGLALGDFNGDGIKDLALGAPGEDHTSPALSQTGHVYLIMGKNGLTGNVDIDSASNVVMTGGMVNDQIGSTLAAGDFNGDGIDDIAIGAPLSGWGQSGTTGKGKVQVVFGSSSMSGTLDLFDDSDVNLQLSDSAAKIGFKTGMEILAADVNSDSVADLVISSPNAFTKSGTNGWVHVVYGGSSLKSNYDLDTDADIAVIAPDPESKDPLSKGRMGQSMAIGDFNNDGKPDLALGAPWGSGNNNFVGSGWFGVISDPAGSGTVPPQPQSCITMGQDLSLPFPHLEYNAMAFGVTFIWVGTEASPLDFVPIDFIEADTGAGKITVNADLSIEVPCADVFGTQYEFTLKPNAAFTQWSVDLNTLKAK